MFRKARTTIIVALGVVVAAVAAGVTLTGVQAASSGSLYSYDFYSSNGTVANQATANTGVNMNLQGSWTSNADGTTFAGNTVNTQSGGYADPAGDTLNVAASESLGASVQFVYKDTCDADSQNISQIGPFAAGVSQVKMQLSTCKSGKTYPECRFAGALTPTGTPPVRGSTVLVDGKTYRLSCIKSPDTGASATVVMEIIIVDAQQGNETTTNSFTIPATGAVRSTHNLSVGNKSPLPKIARNTDQFIGTVAQLGYCKGTSTAATKACLDEEVLIQTDDPVGSSSIDSSVDEIKYAFGNTASSVVFSWRGNVSTIYYGPTSNYGYEVAAVNSSITPVDIVGPFKEATLTGLTPGATYHYKIGVNGQDQTFSTAPADTNSFRVLSVGDTIASTCRTHQTQMNQLMFAQNANFMIHGGDISIANECGQSAVHQYYQDMQPLMTKGAFMPAWGNHEYGQPTANAPAGTPRDTLANYKGRSFIPNAQTVPSNTAAKTSNPGCGAEIASTVNTCRGEDWGWYKAGRVLFITYSPNWAGAIADWKVKAGARMAQAQNDPTIDYIITYGHHPVVSSTAWVAPSGYQDAFTTLGNQYGAGSVPGGKYIMNITQHRHTMEVVDTYHGVLHVVNGGGGQGLIKFQTPYVTNSIMRAKHLGFSTIDYNANTRTLTLKMICGPNHSSQDVVCTPGSTLFSRQFTK